MPAATIADATEPRLRHSLANGVSHAHFEWRPERRGQAPSLCMVHATGFHGRVWDQVIHHLPGRHVFAVGERGPGRRQTAYSNASPGVPHDPCASTASCTRRSVQPGLAAFRSATRSATAVQPT